MITVAQARATAAKRLAAKSAVWAVEQGQIVVQGRQDQPALTVALHPPSERDMLADQKAAQAWAAQWRDLDPEVGAIEEPGEQPGSGAGAASCSPQLLRVQWETRTWRSIGRQRIPVRLILSTPDAVATFVGGQPARDWRRLSTRATTVISTFGPNTAPVVRRHAKTLTGFDDLTFNQLVEVTQWLLDHPVTAMRPRQLPICGVDSKWFGTHRTLLTALVEACGGTVGIVDADPLIRIRILDPALAGGGPMDFAAPIAQLNHMAYRPVVVFVFENKESVLAMPQVPGALVIHGGGYAVDMLADIDCLSGVPIIYWGDLDSHGFAILNEIRTALEPDSPQSGSRIRSLLMDTDTLMTHRDLWVTEPTPHRGTFPHFTAAEQATLHQLREAGDARLEQERIPWPTAIAALTSAATSA